MVVDSGGPTPFNLLVCAWSVLAIHFSALRGGMEAAPIKRN